MPHKGAPTQRHNQQVLAKPHHNPSDRDQQAREKLQQKVKIRSRAYIQLGEETLETVHRTFQPDIPVILHLPALTDGSLTSKSTATPTLFVIQEGLKDSDKGNSVLLVVPEKYKPIIFNTYHNSLLAGHQGPYHTAMTIRQKFFIHNLMNNVKRYIKTCHTCLKTKPKYMKTDQYMAEYQ